MSECEQGRKVLTPGEWRIEWLVNSVDVRAFGVTETGTASGSLNIVMVDSCLWGADQSVGD